MWEGGWQRKDHSNMYDEVLSKSLSAGGMKGADDGSGDGLKGGGLEAGVLFPRLHVKETNKVGPRAPPRNKMALYEQFTIPSHRFMSSSLPLPSSARKAGSVPLVPQYSVYDRRYMYPQNCVPPPLAYTGTSMGRQLGGHASLGSSTSTIVDGDGELQRVPGVSQVDSSAPSPGPGPLNVVSGAHSIDQPKLACAKKHRNEDDFTVPIYSVPHKNKVGSSLFPDTGVKSMHEGSLNAASGMTGQSAGDGQVEDATGLVCQDLLDATGSCSGKTGTRAARRSKAISELKGSTACNSGLCKTVVPDLFGNVLSPRRDSWPDEPLVSAGNFLEPGSFQDPRNKSVKASAQTAVGCAMHDECAMHGPIVPHGFRDRGQDHDCGMSSGLVLPKDGVTDTEDNHFNNISSIRKVSPNLEKHHHPQGYKTDSIESSGDSEHQGAGNGLQAPEPSYVAGCTGDDSDSSMVDSITIHRISPRHVIGAIGQQEFWRTRKAILRQQRIFSVQVFELHRLVKVQQLMAMSPSVDYTVSEGCSDFVAANLIEKACEKTKIHDAGMHHKSRGSRKAAPSSVMQTEAVTAKGSSCKEGPTSTSTETQGRIGQASVSQVSALYPQVPNAWGYPPYPVNPWLGAMSARTGTYMCHYPPSFAPSAGPLVGAYGPYRPLVSVPGHLSMMSFGLSGYEKWSELFSESCSRYYSWASRHPQCYGSSAPAPAGDPMSLWYSMSQGPVQSHHAKCSVTKSLEYADMFPSSAMGRPLVPRPNFELCGTYQIPSMGSTPKGNSTTDVDRVNSQGPSTAHRSLQQNLSAGDKPEPSRVHREGGWNRCQSEMDSFEAEASTDAASGLHGISGQQNHERSQKRPRDLCVSKETDLRARDEDADVEALQSSASMRNPLPLFPVVPVVDKYQDRPCLVSGELQGGVVKVAPRAVVATPESAAGILLSIQQERRR